MDTMTLKTITREDGLEALRAVVAEAGEDYVYPTVRCVYATCVEGELRCSCLIGHALHRLGVPLHTLKSWDTLAISSVSVKDLATCGLRLDPDTRWCFRAAQRAQDDGLTWGAALRAAETA